MRGKGEGWGRPQFEHWQWQPVRTQRRKEVWSRATATASCLLVTLAWAIASPARGDDSTIARTRQHFERGSQQYNLGHWDDAIREFEKAYELWPDPTLLYDLAQARRRRGDAERALRFYQDYLTKVPKSPQRDEIEKRIWNLQEQIDGGAVPRPATRALKPTVAPLPPPSSGHRPPLPAGQDGRCGFCPVGRRTRARFPHHVH
jgi:tetratricopeptide (TPR) repeat protein